MTSADLHWIANYIWGIADDVLRDLYVRGKYRDVILPMTVLRRLDAVLEDTKQAVLDRKASLDAVGVVAPRVPVWRPAFQAGGAIWVLGLRAEVGATRSAWSGAVRGAEHRACRSGDRRSKPGG